MFAKNKSEIIDYLLIIIGSMIVGFAVSVFFSPNGFVTGGISGLSIIIQDAAFKLLKINVPVWFSNIVLNLPLFAIAYKQLGFKFIQKTLVTTVLMSLFIFLFDFMQLKFENLFLVSIYGGLLAGVGIGCILNADATSGGTDLLAYIIRNKKKNLQVSSLIFIIDLAIILLGLFLFGVEKAMYAVISVFASTKAIQIIVEGVNNSKAVYIISDNYLEIEEFIMHEINRGLTSISGIGEYTNAEKKILFCLVNQKEIVEIKRFVAAVDKNAFLIISDVREVLGEGFRVD